MSSKENYELKLLSKLVEFDTNSIEKNYVECSKFIAKELERIDLETEVIDPREKGESKVTIPNIVSRINVGAEKTVAIAVHYDVVPAEGKWKYPPFKLTVENGKAYGRGASDDKGSIAALIAAIKEINLKKLKYNVVMLVTAEEEVGGKLGLGYTLKNLKEKIDYAIILDASPLFVSVGASGIIWGKILVKGRGGHAGYPFKADNPIMKASKIILKLEKYREKIAKKKSKIKAPPGTPSRNLYPRFTVTMVKAWEKENVSPSTSELRCDRRIIPEERKEEVVKELEQEINKIGNELNVEAEFTVLSKGNGYATDPNLSFVKEFKGVVEKVTGEKIPLCGELGGNDGHFFAKRKIPVICFGNIRPSNNIHTVNEHVNLSDLKLVKNVIINFLQLKTL